MAPATPPRNTRFNADAANWDSNPSVQLATSLAHKALLSRLSPSSSAPTQVDPSTYDVLEIGCGTGLLSLALAPSVRSLTAVDAAEGMIEVLKSKLSPSGSHAHVKNVLPVALLLENPDDARIQTDPLQLTGPASTGSSGKKRRFDLITSHLVLHHIPDMGAVLGTMLGCLNPGTGRVMLTDYENYGPEARRFHMESKMDEVERHGIGRGEMRGLMEEAGFVDIKIEVAFEIEKPVETEQGSGVLGPKMVFPFLVCEGRRP